MKRPYQTQYSPQLKIWLLILGIMVAIMLILTERSMAKNAANDDRRASFTQHIVNGKGLKNFVLQVVESKKGNRTIAFYRN